MYRMRRGSAVERWPAPNAASLAYIALEVSVGDKCTGCCERDRIGADGEIGCEVNWDDLRAQMMSLDKTRVWIKHEFG